MSGSTERELTGEYDEQHEDDEEDRRRDAQVLRPGKQLEEWIRLQAVKQLEYMCL